MTKKESDELLNKIRVDSKINNFVLRGSAAFFGVVAMSLLLFIITISKDVANIQATLVTSDNVIRLKEELSRELGAYLPLKAYLEIEKNRGLIFIDYTDLVANILGVKSEDLERGRTRAIRDLNSYIKTGTTRAGSRGNVDLTAETWTE